MCVILRLSMFFRFRQHVWKRNDESGRRGGEGKVYNFLGAGGGVGERISYCLVVTRDS